MPILLSESKVLGGPHGDPKLKHQSSGRIWQRYLDPHGNLQGGYLNHWKPKSHSLVAPLKEGLADLLKSIVAHSIV